MKKNVLVMAAIGMLLFNTSCGAHHEEEHSEEAILLVTNPVMRDTSILHDYVCQIKSARHIEVRSQERGYIENIYVDEGELVKKGDLMFQIMPTLYNAEVKKVEAEAKVAEIEYLNTQALADSNIVSPNELAMAKAKYDKAMAELSLAQVHLGFTKIRAPFDGITDLFEVKLGSLVEEGELMTSLSDNSEMWVYFNVPEAEYLNLKTKICKDSAIGVDLRMANNKIFDYKGALSTIEADFNNETGNIAFRATFPNPKGLLRHGETGNIEMVVPVKSAILVPQKATFEVLDKRYVYIVDDEDKVHARQIIVSAELEDIYIVSEGLTIDDKIVLEGIRKVSEDDHIEYEYQDPNEVLSHLKLYAE